MSKHINIQANLETYILLTAIGISILALIPLLRLDWKRYGGLFLASAIVGNVLCYLFVSLDFYSFPYRLFPKISQMPVTAITLFFPVLVLLSVRYSPRSWLWKIPFYWVIVHLGMFLEILFLLNTRLIQYHHTWHLWDSYTWWWIYLLVFEWIGGKVIPESLRKPLSRKYLRYGTIGWVVIHFVLILTIFLGGYFLGLLRR
ncbi:CBO0543 family protein [Caldalkalibacillus mannanilyticus]|uniref:CBO0543 family protein n=1 Tax=Caldalkalibacillus mannanilyticus TaxID=1418 RepID=UPI001F191896|nr:CBO0543 family protein [Caldalkalibacillus mannanilyticus]